MARNRPGNKMGLKWDYFFVTFISLGEIIVSVPLSKLGENRCQAPFFTDVARGMQSNILVLHGFNH